jgi:hypothetical protein
METEDEYGPGRTIVILMLLIITIVYSRAGAPHAEDGGIID